MKYVCLLRGINVGGKNKVAMSDLKTVFLDLGFQNVSTYINSGNVIFESEEKEIEKLIIIIESALKQKILPLRVTVMSQKQFQNNLKNAPKDWGKDKTRSHNIAFVRPPVTAKQVLDQIGVTSEEFDVVTAGQSVIFLSYSVKNFGKTAVSKLPGNPIYQQITLRNYNTAIKLLKLLS